MKNGMFKNKKITSALITGSDANFYYLTGISRAYELNSFIILRKNKTSLLICHPLEFLGRKIGGFRTVNYHSKEEMEKVLRNNLKGRVGLNFKSYSLAGYKKIKEILPKRKFVDISQDLANLREIKTTHEIKKISEACKLTQRVLDSVPKIFRHGMSEKDLANELEYRAKKIGAEGLSFPAIVAAGKNATVPHHLTGKTKIKKGFLLIDFGIIYNGYCSDLTRTFFVGLPSEKEKRAYAYVYKAQRDALKKIKPGANGKNIFATADEILKKNFDQNLTHSLGHGIGIDVHDFPAGFSDKYDCPIKENMCFTVEPGFYRGNIGIRIEDVIVVTHAGCKLLSNAPAELVEIR